MRDVKKQDTPQVFLDSSSLRELHRVLFEEAADGMFITSPQGRYVAVNPRGVELCGYSGEELLGMALTDLIPPEDFAGDSTRMADFHQSRIVKNESCIRRKDGRLLQVEVSTRKLPDGNRLDIVADITARRQVEDMLREREQHLRLLTENMVDAISQMNAERAIVYCSPSVERVFGIKPEDLIGKNAYDRVHPGDVERIRQQALEAIAAHAAGLQVQYRYFHGRGEYIWVESMIRLLFDASGGFAGAILGSRDVTESKRAEEELKQANMVVENSPVVLFRWRASEGWPVVMVSRNLIQFGYSPEELLSGAVPFAALVHPEDLDRVGREVQEYSESGAVRFQQEYRIVAKDGGVRWVDDRTLVERDIDGRIVFYQGIVMDITERKRSEEALRKSEALLSDSQAIGHIGSWELDLVAKRLIWSDEVYRMFGLSPQEFSPSYEAFLEAVHPDDRVAVGAAYSGSVREGRDTYEIGHRIVRRDSGEVRFVMEKCEHVKDATGAILRSVGMVQDITELKRAEESHAELSRLLEESLNEIYVFDSDTLRFIQVNSGARKNLGYTINELHLRTPLDLKPDFNVQTFGELISPLRTGAKPKIVIETRHRRKNRSLYDVEVHLQKETFEGRPVFVAIIIDITERKRAEDALRSSLAEKESLLKEVHHRVKNTLQVISSLLNLQFRQAKNVEVQSFLRDTQNRVRSMAILHEILYCSSDLARISFPQYVQSICAHLARSYGSDARKIRLKQEIADVSLSMDQAVPAGLIINELVSNAFKHAFPDRSGGEIIVQVRAADDHRLVLRVADDGAGMPADKEPQSPESLGLRLVDNLVRQLDGQLTISSGPGAVFHIAFPVRPNERSIA